MSDTLELEDLELAGIEEYPADSSVKLHGPPGSGKTTNAAGRVARLIRDYDYSINDVVWITYRRALAHDTLKRLARWDVIDVGELEDPTEGATRFIGTAHAVANRLVAGAGSPIKKGDKVRFCEARNLRYEKKVPWDTPPGQLLFDTFTFARKNLLDPRSESDLRKIPAYQDLKEEWAGSVARAYEDWLAYKAEEEKIMFWEQLAAPLRENVVPGRPVLVIDEYHDAYPLMAKLAEYWADHAEIVIVAGDPHQVVNSFDGADPEFYHRLEYPEVQLPTAWERPPHEHWAVATDILSNAHAPPDMDIRTHGEIHVQRSPRFTRGERGWSVPPSGEEYSPPWFVEEHGTDTMFLARTTYQLDGLARALEAAGVLFETPTSSDVPGWQAPANESMSPRVAVYNGLQKLKRLDGTEFGASGGLSRYQGEGSGQDPDRVVLAAREAAALLDHAQARYLAVSRSDATDRAESWLNAEEAKTASDLNEYVKPEFWNTYTQASRATGYLIKTGQALTNSFSDRDLSALKHALRENHYPVDGRLDTKLYTIHAAKGNQAETVVVYDGITGRVKKEMARSDAERKNEYRTWYVALTRSTNRLYILKGAFDFTAPFLPRGRKILELARQGKEAAVA